MSTLPRPHTAPAARHARRVRRARRLRLRRRLRLDQRRRRSRSTTARPTSSRRSTDDTLTIATDKPAFPPYFEDDDPTNGKGFESAVGYAIADQLGFSEDQVEVDRSSPSTPPTRPVPKDFDFDLNQISITDEARRAGRLLLAVLHGRPGGRRGAGTRRSPTRAVARPTSPTPTIGVQIGTTSLDAVTASIEPNTEPQVFDTSNDVVSALENGQVDAIVVDTPTALYLTAVEIDGGKIIGEFAAPGRRRVGRAAREGLGSDRLRLGGGRRAARAPASWRRSSSAGSTPAAASPRSSRNGRS